MIQQDFSSVKVGDKLWSVQLGDCVVVNMYNEKYSFVSAWPIHCKSLINTQTERYTLSGKQYEEDHHPSLFWVELGTTPKKIKIVKTITGFLNLRKDNINHYGNPDFCFQIHPTKELAEQFHDDGTIACVEMVGSFEIEE